MEILASELRIGNWYDHNGKHCQVSPNTILEVWESPRKWVQPIPLTPEILEKCGLKNGNSELDRNVFYSTNKHLAQFSVNISGSFGIYVGVFIALRSVHLEYLHQLQNLYFALTNEELNYTP